LNQTLRLFVMVGWLFSGCGIDVVEIEIAEQGQAGGAALNFPGMSGFQASIGNALNSKDVDPSDVDSMKLLRCTLEMTSSGAITTDLSFLHDLSFAAQATGVSAAVLASQSTFASGIRRAELAVTPDLELKPFLSAGDMSVSVNADLDPYPPDRVDLRVTFRIRVDVNVL
jgi:hypothetical protein